MERGGALGIGSADMSWILGEGERELGFLPGGKTSTESAGGCLFGPLTGVERLCVFCGGRAGERSGVRHEYIT